MALPRLNTGARGPGTTAATHLFERLRAHLFVLPASVANRSFRWS